MIRNVIFDVGGVMVLSCTADWMLPPHHQTVLGESFLRERLQDFRRAKPAARAFIPDTHQISTVEEEEALLLQYYRCVLNEQVGLGLTEAALATLAADQARSDGRYLYFSDVYPMLPRFRGRFRTGILSDAPPSLERILRHGGILTNVDAEDYAMVDAAVFSFQLGRLKPDPAMYEAILEKLHAEPEETVFVDDTPGNLVGCEKLGIHGVQMRRTLPNGFYEPPQWDGAVVHDLEELYRYCETH